MAIKIDILGSHCSRSAMVALDTTDSYNAISTLRYGICHKKFKLPNFVAAQFHASEIIPL
jgi:hypothetical protein